MRKGPQECKCNNGDYGIWLWGVVSFDYTTREFFLHAVDRTEERANDHKKIVQDEYRLKETRAVVRIERFESDHAFAKLNIGK